MKNSKNSVLSVRAIAQIGILSAVAVGLMFFEIPLFFIPVFYKLDFSEIPIMIGAFSMGPAAGVLIEALKNILKILIKGTDTVGVGELANFLIGVSYVLPAALFYRKRQNKKGAIIGASLGVGSMIIFGSLLNAFVLLPFYASMYGMPLEALVQMGAEVNASITDLTTFVLLGVAPFNLIKGVAVSVILLILYRYIVPLLQKENHRSLR